LIAILRVQNKQEFPYKIQRSAFLEIYLKFDYIISDRDKFEVA